MDRFDDGLFFCVEFKYRLTEQMTQFAQIKRLCSGLLWQMILELFWGEPQLLNKLDVDEVELILPVPSPKSSNVGLPNELSIGLPERLSKELSKGLSETAATIYKLIYVDNYITRGDIAKK